MNLTVENTLIPFTIGLSSGVLGALLGSTMLESILIALAICIPANFLYFRTDLYKDGR